MSIALEKTRYQPSKQVNKGLKSKDNSSLDQRLLFTVLPLAICAQPPIRRRNHADRDNLLWPSELAVAGVVCSIVRLTHGHELRNEAYEAGNKAINKAKAKLLAKGYRPSTGAIQSTGSLAYWQHIGTAEPLAKVEKIYTSWRAIMRALGVRQCGRNSQIIAKALDRLTEPVTLADGTEFPPLIRKWYIGKKTGKLWLHVNTPAWVPTKPGSFRRVKWPLPKTSAALTLHLLASTMDLRGTRYGINRQNLTRRVTATNKWERVKVARDTVAEVTGIDIKFARHGKHVVLKRKRSKAAK